MYSIHVVNTDFHAQNETEAVNVEAARALALRSALEIGTEEVWKGLTQYFGAEVRVELDGNVCQRFTVGIGQSPLM